MTALATAEDYTARYGDAPDEADAWLGDASDLILNEVAASTRQWVLDARSEEAVEDPEDVPRSVISICVAVAYRGLQNPEGIQSETLGAHSVTLRDSDREDSLYLTSQERRIVRRAAGLGTASAVILETPYSGSSSGSSIADNDLV